jgi:hypothetical protein
MPTEHHTWLELVGPDPVDWLMKSEEAPARWLTLKSLVGGDEETIRRAQGESIASQIVQDLIARITPWGGDRSVSGHHSPAYLPNLLQLLADLGVRGADDARIERALDELAARQRDDGRFLSFGRARRQPNPVWGSLPCDTHSITEVLIRYGRLDEPATQRGLERMAADMTSTKQGRAWTCIPDEKIGFRGPGRKGDICPQVTLEALRAFARVPARARPDGLAEVARALLGVWDRRGLEQPYMFGHGARFKTVKWPPFWYGSFWMLDTLGRYPDVWTKGDDDDRRCLAEMVACLIAYNVSADGTVTPKSVYRGFEGFSFGQKKRPSPIATAMVAGVVGSFGSLAPEISTVDIGCLSSSKGGTGSPRLPVS